jgi:hypothetical protein
MLAHRIGQDISVEEIHSLLLATISYYLLCRLPKLHQFALMRIYAFHLVFVLHNNYSSY